ncbi:MAG: glycosyltransferase family 4 protein [Candidatus Peribacteraceae bacterium]|nr:glycosyltransferase family 4 protein [Candidatus Peribacteraceae bacterium]
MPHSLHIGMVSFDSPPHIGGMGRHVGTLVEGLKKEGIQVSLFDRTKRPIHSRIARSIGFSCGIEQSLRRWIEREGINLLHVHTGPGGVLLRRRIEHIPLVVTANHTYAQQSALAGQSWKKFLIPWEKRTYLLADRIICISQDTADIVRDRYGIDPAKIVTIPCGFDLMPWIDADHSPDQRDPSRCVFAGRPDARKGWDLLLAAWPIIRSRHPEAMLDAAGFVGEPMDGVTYHGRVSDDQLRTMMGSAALTMVPSRFEGFGLIAAESIACGTPVIATNVAGLRTVVDFDRSGLLVAPDARSIAEAAMRVLQDRVLWNRLHAECQAGRGRFDLRTEIDAQRKVYRLQSNS